LSDQERLWHSCERLVRQVDFPNFVPSLIKGLFHAIVDATIQQMDAYSQRVRQVTRSSGESRGA
jgi:hypothetical protein